MSPTTIAVIGLVLSAVGTASSFISAKKAQKTSKSQFEESNRLRREAEEKSKRLADLQTLRAKRAAAREAQARRADVLSSATVQGAGTSTAVTGARGSIATQLSTNLSFLDRANQLQTQTVALLGQAGEAAARPIFTSTIGASIAGFGGTIFSERKDISTFIKSFR